MYVNNMAVTETGFKLSTDGQYLYFLKADKTVHRGTVSAGLITDLGVVLSNVGTLGKGGLKLATMDASSLDVTATDPTIDYDFDYPIALVPEYMAYKCAVVIKSKFNADRTQLIALLKTQQDKLVYALNQWDNGMPERINNHFKTPGLIW
jgi:hypothetical protein